jgi:transposase InsO family protein
VENLPGRKKRHFLMDAADHTGKPVNPDDPCDVGALPAVVPLPRSQQAVGNQVKIFMVNNTDSPAIVEAHAVVGVGALTQEQEKLAETLSQVGADPHIQRVHGVRAGAGDDLSNAPPKPPTDREFLESMELGTSHWYVQASRAQQRRVDNLLLSYRDTFTDDQQKVGRCDIDGDFKIELEPGTRPVKGRDRSLKPDQLDSLRQQLKDWTADSVIGPSDSPWASPLVPVMKKDGTTRWAVDYRALNLHTIPDSFPTPRIAEVLEGLAGSKVFSTLDAAQAYHNVPVDPDSQSLTAFICHFGLFVFKRMPFGLRNAGAKYCRIVQSLVDSLDVDGVLAYLDDLLLHTPDIETHITLMGQVLEAHRTVGIKLKAAKTRWLQKKVSYLGYDVSEEGIHLTTKFIDQVREWPTPTSGTELASMLGFFGYYRESLPQYSELTAAMNELKAKRKWTGGEWTPEMQHDFETLKRLFIEDGGPVRAHPMIPDGGDAGEFVLATDWSAQAMAGVLSQFQHGKLRFVAAKGRKCRGYETRYHSSKGELAALHYSLTKFERWLRLAEFTVLSDNTTCTNWSTMEITNGCVRRWTEYFTLFNFRIKHVAGKLNVPPDTMSRRTDLPNPTPSEFRHGRDVETRFPLDPNLPKLPSESSVPLGVNWAGSNGTNRGDPCYLGKRCRSCHIYLTTNGLTEPDFPGGVSVALDSIHPPSATPFPDVGEGEPDPLPFALALVEAQRNDPACQAFRLWIESGRDGPPPHQKPAFLNTFQDEDPDELKWLGTLDLELEHLTGPGRPRVGEVLVHVHDPTLPRNDLSRYRLVCPPALRQHVIEQKHTKGHWGINKTIQAIQENYCWPRIRHHVTQFLVYECVPCIENERANLKEGIHVPRVSHEQGEIVYVDLVGPFSHKITPFRYLLTIMDGFSRFVAVAPLQSKSAAEVGQGFLDQWVKVHGVPRSVYSDQGTEFTARLTQNLFQELGVHAKLGTPDNHQANPLERFHRTLYGLVKSLRQEGETNFVSGVRTAVMLYNGSIHASLGVTPNSLKFGHEVPGPADMLLGRPPLGPEDGPPGVLAERLRRENAVDHENRHRPAETRRRP